MATMYLARRLIASVFLMYVSGVLYCYVYGEDFLALRVPVPTNSAEVKRAALFAVLEYNKNHSTRATAFKTVRIISAERQMLEGVSYFLNVKLGLTTCLKNTTAIALRSCPLQAHGTVLLCDFVVAPVLWTRARMLKVTGCTKLSGL